MKKLIAVSVLFFTVLMVISGQDQRERRYLYPVLNPQHYNKSKVEGWADERVKENLDRGLIAIKLENGQVYLGWRLLETDQPDISFNVFRSSGNTKAEKVNDKPVQRSTDFIDADLVADTETFYWVVPVSDGKEGKSSDKVRPQTVSEKGPAYSSISFKGEYMAQKIAIADLNGDGKYDFVIKHPDSSIDPAQRPDTTGKTYKLEAYLSDGTFLWQYDLGPGIEPGIWYSPYIVYDFDGDGKAEIAAKTAPGVERDPDGRVRRGIEQVSILDGMTGKEIATAPWPERDPRYGDYNRLNRNQIGVAYLDGKTPFLLLARGTYKLMTLDAWQFHNGELEQTWHWDGDEENPVIRHQGAHSMHSVDIDGDGRDEVVLGAVAIDDDGTALWSTGYGHPDKVFVTDIDPLRPGLEIAYIQEDWNFDGNGVNIVDARTGRTVWGIGHKTYHVGNGMVADIDPSIPGLEFFAAEDPKGNGNGRSRDRYMLSAQGKYLARNEGVPRNQVNWIFWDEDLLREDVNWQRPQNWQRGERFSMEDISLSINKYDGSIVTAGIQGRVKVVADINGDWREELITVLPGELRIYTTTIPAKDRRVCLMQDAIYRNDVAHHSMGYDQVPLTGYYLGVSPEDADKFQPIEYPPIKTVEEGE